MYPAWIHKLLTNQRLRYSGMTSRFEFKSNYFCLIRNLNIDIENVIGSSTMDHWHTFFWVLRFCIQHEYTTASQFFLSTVKFDQSQFKIIWYSFQIWSDVSLFRSTFAFITKFKCKLCFFVVRWRYQDECTNIYKLCFSVFMFLISIFV